MTHDQVQAWLDAYIAAWKSYEPEAIAALFSDDVRYLYHPADEPIVGREAVVESWLGQGEHPDASEPDEPGSYDAAYAPFAVEGDRAVATGSSRYFDDGGKVTDVYDNCFVISFDGDGRCREFTEWFVKRP